MIWSQNCLIRLLSFPIQLYLKFTLRPFTAAFVDGYCFSPTSFKIGVPQSSVVSTTLFPFPTHCYTDDTVHNFPHLFGDDQPIMKFPDRADITQNPWHLIYPTLVGTEKKRKNSTAQYLENLRDNYTIFCSDTQLFLFSTLKIVGLSFTYNLNCKHHIWPLAKRISIKLCVLRRKRQFLYLS